MTIAVPLPVRKPSEMELQAAAAKYSRPLALAPKHMTHFDTMPRAATRQARSSTRHKENRMTTNYVLYIGYDCGAAGVSVWPSVADVEANLGGLTGDLLKPGDPFPPPAASFAAGLMKIGIIGCRIIKCAADGSTSVWFEPFTSRG
jgi:hypothetical protein